MMTLTYFTGRSTKVAYAFEKRLLLKCHVKGNLAGNEQYD